MRRFAKMGRAWDNQITGRQRVRVKRATEPDQRGPGIEPHAANLMQAFAGAGLPTKK